MSTRFCSEVINVLFIMLILLTVSCRATPPTVGPTYTPLPTVPINLTDRSWLTDQPCRAPCWYSLKIGTTSITDAQKMVIELPFIDPNSVKNTPATFWDPISDEGLDSRFLSYSCKQPNSMVCSSLQFVQNKLIEIRLYPNYQITLKEVVDSIGPPDYVEATAMTPEIVDCMVRLYWWDRQMTISYRERKENTGRDLCQMYKDAGHKPLPNLNAEDVWIVSPDFLSWLGKHDPWTGFLEQK